MDGDGGRSVQRRNAEVYAGCCQLKARERSAHRHRPIFLAHTVPSILFIRLRLRIAPFPSSLLPFPHSKYLPKHRHGSELLLSPFAVATILCSLSSPPSGLWNLLRSSLAPPWMTSQNLPGFPPRAQRSSRRSRRIPPLIITLIHPSHRLNPTPHHGPSPLI